MLLTLVVQVADVPADQEITEPKLGLKFKKKGHRHIPLKVRNNKFIFDVRYLT